MKSQDLKTVMKQNAEEAAAFLTGVSGNPRKTAAKRSTPSKKSSAKRPVEKTSTAKTKTKSQKIIPIETDESVIASAKETFSGAMEECRYYFTQYEDVKLNAYNDGYGTWTIGFGNTTHPDGRPIRKGDHITLDEAVEYFESYQLKKSWPEIKNYLKVGKMTASDFVAVSCIMWNCGPGCLKNKDGTPTELANALNEFFDNRESVEARNAVQKQFAKRVYSGGKYVKGLDRRRNLEMMVLLGEVRIGMEPNTTNDPCYICLADIKKGVFNSVPMDMAKSYDRNNGIYTAAQDSVQYINNYDKGETVRDTLERLNKKKIAQKNNSQNFSRRGISR